MCNDIVNMCLWASPCSLIPVYSIPGPCMRLLSTGSLPYVLSNTSSGRRAPWGQCYSFGLLWIVLGLPVRWYWEGKCRRSAGKEARWAPWAETEPQDPRTAGTSSTTTCSSTDSRKCMHPLKRLVGMVSMPPNYCLLSFNLLVITFTKWDQNSNSGRSTVSALVPVLYDDFLDALQVSSQRLAVCPISKSR